MELTAALQHAIDGNAVLFLGSGASAGAKPVLGDKFLTGRELAVHLSTLAKVTPPSEDLNFAAQRYRKKIGDVKLVELLQGLFSVSEVAKHHQRMSEIPWKGIYTTNYDNVLERAYADKKKKLTAVTPDQDSREFTARRNVVVHINGYIETLTTEALNEGFKLTNTSYLTESFSKSNWSFLFRRAIETARAVIFIGYSMYDLDIQRILFAGDDSKSKTIFIERDGKSIEEIDNSIQIDFGNVLPIGIDGFLNEFDVVSKNYKAQDQSQVFFSFEELHFDALSAPLRDDDLFNLLLKGEVRNDAVWDKVNSNASQPYYIVRDQIEKSVKAISSGIVNIFVIADLANGKSMFCLGLACRLASQAFRVFWLKDDAENPEIELDRICDIPGKVLVVIENYTRRISDLKNIQFRRSTELILLLSAKTSLHEVYQPDLQEFLDLSKTYEHELNTLSSRELTDLGQILGTYKLWGERDAWPDRKKRNLLEIECGGQLSGVLLDIIQSPTIQTRFHSLFETFHTKSEIADVVVAASVLKLLGINSPRESVISEIIGSNYLYSLDFKRNPLARELLSLQGGGVIPRSSIVAKYGLISSNDSRALVDRLIKMATNAHDRGADSDFFHGIYKDLVNFSVLQSMLPEKGKRDSMIRFYEAIKNLRAAKDHPHFWLQYAIARLASDRPDDLRMAKLFLDTAYAHAQQRKNYHTKHMDNVLARYWIQHAKITHEPTAAMIELADGHALLLKQCRSEASESPFKVARQYLIFYNTKKAALSDAHKKMVRKMAEGILELIPRLPEHLQMQSTVKFCKSDLQSLLDDIDASNGKIAT